MSVSPRCPVHERAAVATCARCGTVLCGECTELLGEAAYCASCLSHVRRGRRLPRGLSLGLGLLFLLWLAGWLLR
ncbi:MAG TPA: hypothetical protein VLQ93_13825 [Myxococcaceae bacterium]|nr:hypothetical protein [Myxococcaceae bacterium]